MEKGANRRRKSIRLKGFDYSQGNFYFVTICVRNKQHLLGTIANQTMVLNRLGELVVTSLEDTERHFQSVTVDTYSLMPNHIHLIIALSDIAGRRRGSVCESSSRPPTSDSRGSVCESSSKSPTPDGRGSVCVPASIQTAPTLGQVVAYFKFMSTKFTGQFLKDPQFRLWQRNYYEHVIRNEQDILETRRYIVDNPLRWELDQHCGR